MALVAVGGYGRQDLFPHSDIDLMFLIAGEAPVGPAKEALARFLQHLWDEGLRMSHSAHTVRECCEMHDGNLELTISLLDQRFLTGDRKLYDELAAKLPRFLQSQRTNIGRQLCKMARQRHSKFQGTIYHLEPNIKEGPGGFRDLHVLGWLDKLGVAQAAEGLAESGAAGDFLGGIRCLLHYRSNRDDNKLSFEAQEECAEFAPLGAATPEIFMREFFRHARAIHRHVIQVMDAFESKGSSLLDGFRDWRSRLSNAEFTISRDRILFRAHEQLTRDPALALRLFQFAGRHKVALHPETERRVRENLPAISTYLGSAPDLWSALRDLLTLPHAAFALRAMHDTGVLGALFPAWQEIECYVVRDFNHRYTVDEHTLIALESIDQLKETKEPERKRFAALLDEMPNVAVLRLALVFHDTGKGGETDSHSIESANLADEAATRIGMPAAERQMLRTLIEQHLTLSAAMSRDLEDPATARWLAERVGTIETLRALTLLTMADIGAVHPSALSQWRSDQLWRVFLAANRELTRELEDSRITEFSAADGSLQEFLKGFPTRYLRIHTREEIDYHFELEQQRKVSGIALDIRKRGGAYELTVLAKDRLFLFASVAGALASFGLNILKAEAFANQQGTILDTFTFADPQRNLELNPQEMERLRQTVERVLLGRVEVKALLKNRPKPQLPTSKTRLDSRVGFDSEASAAATLVEVVAQDRPGLLYDLASAFSEAGCNIDVVLIDTEAHKALDVFYVTANGRKLDEDEQAKLRERLLSVCAA